MPTRYGLLVVAILGSAAWSTAGRNSQVALLKKGDEEAVMRVEK